jgi:uncharacterized protein (TIGR03067 family)
MMMVRKVVLWLISAGVLLAADNTDMATNELIKQDYDRLTGTFLLVSGVVDGQPVPEEVRRKTILVTDHNKFTVTTGDEAGTSARGTFTIDPTKTPKTADSLQEDGPDKGKTLFGIYEIIDDNHKRACWAPVGKPRPTAFVSEPGSGHILQLWERQNRE